MIIATLCGARNRSLVLFGRLQKANPRLQLRHRLFAPGFLLVISKCRVAPPLSWLRQAPLPFSEVVIMVLAAWNGLTEDRIC
jgi:hypothetical protein